MSDRQLSASDVQLELIEELIWQLLQDAAESSSNAMRFPVLATRTDEGVDARVLVLRRVDRDSRTLEFHTDKRSSKVEQITQNPDLIWVFYAPEHKLQLRVRGPGAVCQDSHRIDARWNALSPHTKRAYAQNEEPGKRVAAINYGAPCSHVEDPETGKVNFAVVECLAEEFEWLLLSRDGHQRALVSFGEDGWSSSWLMP